MNLERVDSPSCPRQIVPGDRLSEWDMLTPSDVRHALKSRLTDAFAKVDLTRFERRLHCCVRHIPKVDFSMRIL